MLMKIGIYLTLFQVGFLEFFEVLLGCADVKRDEEAREHPPQPGPHTGPPNQKASIPTPTLLSQTVSPPSLSDQQRVWLRVVSLIPHYPCLAEVEKSCLQSFRKQIMIFV